MHRIEIFTSSEPQFTLMATAPTVRALCCLLSAEKNVTSPPYYGKHNHPVIRNMCYSKMQALISIETMNVQQFPQYIQYVNYMRVHINVYRDSCSLKRIDLQS